MVGAGFMGQGLTNQITNSVPGMRVAAIYNRTPERAIGVYRYAGCENAGTAGAEGGGGHALPGGGPGRGGGPPWVRPPPGLARCRSRPPTAGIGGPTPPPA